MSIYFDEMSRNIHECADTADGWDTLKQLEEAMVFDVSVCAMFPDFPGELRVLIHQSVLRYGVYALPENAPPADFDTFDEHKRRISDLCGDLHTIFHEVAHQGGSDRPYYQVHRLAALAAEERAALVGK